MDPPPEPAAAIAAGWAATLSQNLLHAETSPVAGPLERLVIGWLAPLFGQDGGHLVPGSTVANLTALWAAREAGCTSVAASPAAHHSIAKAAHLLGLTLHMLPVDASAGVVAHESVFDGVADPSRCALVLTAGVTSTGLIDPLHLFEGRGGQAFGWRHCDAAWGGPIRLGRHGGRLDGIDAADSISMSGHKWLFQPRGSAVVMFRDTPSAHASLTGLPAEGNPAGYLRQANFGVLGSRPDLAMPLAATLLAQGREGVGGAVDTCLEIAADLMDRLASSRDWLLWPGHAAEPERHTGVILFRHREHDPDSCAASLDPSLVSRTPIPGQADSQPWLRHVISHPETDAVEIIDRLNRQLVQRGGRPAGPA